MTHPFRTTILTLFPDLFPGPLGASLPGKALKEGLWNLHAIDIRTHATDKHATVDDTPYGGGAGMVMRPDIIDAATRAAERNHGPHARKIYLSPRGRPLDQLLVKQLASEPSLLLLCGRYEGIDQRVLDAHAFEEISIGDYVLAGGEVAAMVLLEACIRLLPNVLGNAATTQEETFESGLLEYPHYTRPAVWNNTPVPETLISGNHAKINQWRQQQSEQLTQKRRPDLWRKFTDKK